MNETSKVINTKVGLFSAINAAKRARYDLNEDVQQGVTLQPSVLNGVGCVKIFYCQNLITTINYASTSSRLHEDEYLDEIYHLTKSILRIMLMATKEQTNG